MKKYIVTFAVTAVLGLTGCGGKKGGGAGSPVKRIAVTETCSASALIREAIDEDKFAEVSPLQYAKAMNERPHADWTLMKAVKSENSHSLVSGTYTSERVMGLTLVANLNPSDPKFTQIQVPCAHSRKIDKPENEEEQVRTDVITMTVLSLGERLNLSANQPTPGYRYELSAPATFSIDERPEFKVETKAEELNEFSIEFFEMLKDPSRFREYLDQVTGQTTDDDKFEIKFYRSASGKKVAIRYDSSRYYKPRDSSPPYERSDVEKTLLIYEAL